MNSIATQWASAAPGATISLAPGVYPRETLKPSKRPAGSPPVTIKATPPGSVLLLRDDAVGSTDALILKSGLRDLVLEGLVLEVDDRAGLKTEGPKGARKVSLINCSILGRGNGPTDPLWRDTGKWGQHHYFTGAWSEINTKIARVFQEHADYRHQIQGNHAFYRSDISHCGRTRIQVVNRKSEAGTPMPIGYGDFFFLDETVTDVCLEQGGGGSAYTFRGGMPTSNVKLEGCKVRLGCDPALAAPFNRNITGALVMDSSPPSQPGAGDEAHPGGTHMLTLEGCDFEVGTVWPGVGSARRPNVKVNNVGSLLIRDCRIAQGPKAFTIALEIGNQVGMVTFAGNNQIVGQVKYRGATFANFSAFRSAHPECFV